MKWWAVSSSLPVSPFSLIVIILIMTLSGGRIRCHGQTTGLCVCGKICITIITDFSLIVDMTTYGKSLCSMDNDTDNINDMDNKSSSFQQSWWWCDKVRAHKKIKHKKNSMWHHGYMDFPLLTLLTCLLEWNTYFISWKKQLNSYIVITATIEITFHPTIPWKLSTCYALFSYG